MAIVSELAALSEAIYGAARGETIPGWSQIDFRPAWKGWLADGLQAGAYACGGERVIAFRGTNPSLYRPVAMIQDLAADLVLGAGANTAYYEAAEEFVAKQGALGESVFLCGHSLGGAIAQILGKRLGVRFVTFNAPGVAVIDSPYRQEAWRVPDAVRKVGMAVSAITYPTQTLKDIKAAGAVVRGLNVMLDTDRVSKYGLHYGQKVVVPSKVQGWALTQHSISAVIASIKDTIFGNRIVSSL